MSKQIVSVRPTREGQWEVVQTTVREDTEWWRKWKVWFAEHGERLQAENPHWWAKK